MGSFRPIAYFFMPDEGPKISVNLDWSHLDLVGSNEPEPSQLTFSVFRLSTHNWGQNRNYDVC